MARVCTADGVAVGAGVLLTPSLLATCAHVVATALGHDAVADEAPDDGVRIDLPFLPGTPSRSGRIRRWAPPTADGGGDIALLDLDAPAPAVVVPEWTRPRPWGTAFRVVGFPVGREDGVWAEGRLRAVQGSGWLQLAVDDGSTIGPGFSGAPVLDATTGTVLGLAVTDDRLSRGRTAYALTADDVLPLAPEVLANPFPGARAFTAEDHDLFVGREEETARCREVLAEHGVVVIAAGSGQGATSLLQAGLRAAAPDVVIADRLDLHPDPAAWLREQTRPVVGTARADRWQRIAGDPALQAVTVTIDGLDRERLRRAVLEPAASRPGPTVDAATAARLVDDAADAPGGLALLQRLLHRSVEDGTPPGDVGAAAVAVADAAWADLDEANRAVARPLLLGLVRAHDDGFGPGELPLDGLDDARHAVLETLAAARVVTIGRGGRPVAEPAHRALVDRWSPLADQLAADGPFLRWHDEARARARTWRRDPTVVLRAEALEQAEEHVENRAADVDGTVHALVAASRDRRARERRRRLVLIAVLLVLVLTTGLLTVSVSRVRLAAARATHNAETLGALSLAALPGDPSSGTQLALAAYRSDPSDVTARNALARAYVERRLTTSTMPVAGADDPAAVLVPDPEAEDTMVVAPGSALFVYRLYSPTPVFETVPGRDADTRPVSVSDGGRFVVLRTDTGAVRVWDRNTTTPPRFVPGSAVASVVATPDGTHLLATGPDGSGTLVSRVDLEALTSTVVARLPEAGDTAAPTADPTRLLITTPDGARTVRDATTGAVVGAVPTDAGVGLQGTVTVRCDTDPDETVVVADTATGAVRTRVPTGPHGCAGRPAMITAEGAHLVWLEGAPGTSATQPIQVVDLPDGRRRAAWVPSASAVMPPSAAVGIPVNPRFDIRHGQGELIDHGQVDGLNLLDSPTFRAPSATPPPVLKGPVDAIAVVPDATGATAFDAFGPRALGRLDAPPGGWSSVLVSPTAGSFLAVDRAPTGPRIDEYDLPRFRPLGSYPLPPSHDPPVVLARGGDDLVDRADGALTWFSATSHRPLAPPVPVGTGAAAASPDASQVAVREPGAIGLFSPGGIVASFPTTGAAGGMLLEANRLLSVDDPGDLVARAVPSGAVTARVPVPTGTGAVLGVDGADRPVTWDATLFRLAIWDVAAGRQVADVPLPPGVAPRPVAGGRIELDEGDVAFSIPTDADLWRVRLCQTQNRDFSATERTELPSGTSEVRPCSLADE
ncbi:hypothetical protein GCM10023201_33590 [Actinomycetospora corticicola]